MAPSGKPGEGEIERAPGLAGGPGPNPPGVEDGTPTPRPAQPETPEAGRQRQEGEDAERSAGVRRADVPALADEREGKGDPADETVREQERRTRR